MRKWPVKDDHDLKWLAAVGKATRLKAIIRFATSLIYAANFRQIFEGRVKYPGYPLMRLFGAHFLPDLFKLQIIRSFKYPE